MNQRARRAEKTYIQKLADKYWNDQLRRLGPLDSVRVHEPVPSHAALDEDLFIKAHRAMHEILKELPDPIMPHDEKAHWLQWALETPRGVPGIGKTETFDGFALPRGWTVVAAGNRPEDRSGAALPAHLLSSPTHVMLDEDVIGTPEEEQAKTAMKRKVAERLFNLAMDKSIEGMLVEPLPRSKRRAKRKA